MPCLRLQAAAKARQLIREELSNEGQGASEAAETMVEVQEKENGLHRHLSTGVSSAPTNSSRISLNGGIKIHLASRSLSPLREAASPRRLGGKGGISLAGSSHNRSKSPAAGDVGAAGLGQGSRSLETERGCAGVQSGQRRSLGDSVEASNLKHVGAEHKGQDLGALGSELKPRHALDGQGLSLSPDGRDATMGNTMDLGALVTELKPVVEQAEADGPGNDRALVVAVGLLRRVMQENMSHSVASVASPPAAEATELLSLAWRALAAGNGAGGLQGLGEECVDLLTRLQSRWRL